MSIIDITDEVARYYPILDITTINGVEIKHLVNFDRIYERVKDLGSGAYGCVGCYREIATGNLYAFKEIEIHDRTNIRVLQDEVTVLARLSETNPSIVKYQDSFVYMKGHQYIYVIVTEYIDGFTLHNYINQLLRENSIARLETVMNIFIWLFSLIAEIHAAGYVHRDIKPENIMVDNANKRMVLLDFGLTCSLKRRSSDRDRLMRTMGTPEFIAPERWVFKKSKFSFRLSDLSVWKKADIWAAGVTLYCILERRYPWTTEDIYTMGHQIVGPYTITYTYFQSEVIHFLSQILNRDPQRRPTAIEAVRQLKLILYDLQAQALQEKLSDPFMRLMHQGDPVRFPVPAADSDSSSNDSTDDSSEDDESSKQFQEPKHVTFSPVILEGASILSSIPKLKLIQRVSSDNHLKRGISRTDTPSPSSLSKSDPLEDNHGNRIFMPDSPRTMISKFSPRRPTSPHSKDGIISSRGSPRTFRSPSPTSPRKTPSPHTKDGIIPSGSPTSPLSPSKRVSPRTDLLPGFLRRFQ